MFTLVNSVNLNNFLEIMTHLLYKKSNTDSELDSISDSEGIKIMGLISLCHPDQKKSCGACCGLYNWEDNSRKTLTELMRKRREVYQKVVVGDTKLVNPESIAPESIDIMALKRGLQEISPPKVLFDGIHNCPFVGFIDDNNKRVGCMIHPVNNGGVELRDISFYGAELCNGHECPSFQSLTLREKEAVSMIIDDWYLYGLVITDIDLVKEFFTIAANRIGEEIDPEWVLDPRVKVAALNFFRLKETWPFAKKENRFGKYSFSKAEYNIEREVAKGRFNIPPSPYEKIFLSLASDFKLKGEASRADEIIDRLISDFIQACELAGFVDLSGGGLLGIIVGG